VRLLAAVVASVSLTTPAQFLQSSQAPDGSFAEVGGGGGGPALTALAAAGESTGSALAYLRAHEQEAAGSPTLALVAFAEAALGDGRLAADIPVTVGQTNALIWTILARRQAGLPVPMTLARALLRRQAKSGGWGWERGVAPDSNDTSAAVQALRSVGVTGRPIRQALAYLETLQRRDGGFALVASSVSDAQSTAWAIQAFLAAGRSPPKGAFAYLGSLRQRDGSYRLSRRYATTPVWVTAQVLPALARRPFPLRPVRG
jgi:prenyltransferase/squalene oxidase-like repeat protein